MIVGQAVVPWKDTCLGHPLCTDHTCAVGMRREERRTGAVLLTLKVMNKQRARNRQELVTFKGQTRPESLQEIVIVDDRDYRGGQVSTAAMFASPAMNGFSPRKVGRLRSFEAPDFALDPNLRAGKIHPTNRRSIC